MKDEEEQQGKSSSFDTRVPAVPSRKEFHFINAIRQRAALDHSASSAPANQLASLVSGIGDDAAVIRTSAGKDTVVTADLLVEDIDFRRDAMPPYLLGHKVL